MQGDEISMVQSFSKKRPSFAKFRQVFLETVKNKSNNKDIDSFSAWDKTGSPQERSLILAAFKDKLVEQFGLGKDLKIDNHLVNLAGPVESVITQLFHSFSTLSLVEHINESVLEQQKARREEKL